MLDVRPLRSTTFRRLAAAYGINELGTWFGDIALALLVFDRTSSALATACLFLVLRCIPSVLAPLLTARVEAWPARRALPLLYLGEAVLYGLIALVTHHFSLPAILILAGFDGVLAITAKALARSATANTLLEQGLLREGNAILNMAFMASSALGPALAGVVSAWKGPACALIVDAVTFAATALLLCTVRDLHVESDHEAGAWGRLRTGLRTVRSDRPLRWLFSAFAVAIMLASIAVPIEVVFAKQTLHAGSTGYGFLLGAWGVGMIAGGVTYAAVKSSSNGQLLAAAMALVAVGYGGLAAAPDMLVALIFSAIGGIGNGIGGVTAITAVQEAIPLTTQSAVMSVFEGINQAMPAVGFVVGGAVTSVWSPRAAYAVSAVGVALVLGIGALRATSIAGSAQQSADDVMTTPTVQISGMTEIRTSESGSMRREQIAAVIHVLMLLAVVVVSVFTASEAHWDLSRLAVLIALVVGSELLAVLLVDPDAAVTAGFLGVMVAAVLLGGVPAAIVGIVTILVGWTRSREHFTKLLHNLANYSAFPLIAGLVFHAVVTATAVHTNQTDYYLLVFGVFLLGLALNWGIAAGYLTFAAHLSLLRNAAWMKQLVAPELFAAMLTLTCTYITNTLGAVGLLMVALVIGVFQYLVTQLLISQRRGEELRLRATTDELTKLFNRSHFGELLAAEIGMAADRGYGFGILLLDLDHFKNVNDTLGHESGDQLLQQLAPRLADYVGEEGILSRFDSDEFGILPSLRTARLEDLDRIATELRQRIQEPFEIGDITLTINASVGVARYPEDGLDAQTLLRRADIALHDAKQQRDGHSFYESGRDHHSARQLSLVGDFRRALESGDQIVMVYQPIIGLPDRRLHGVEALVRWHHPELGFMPPGTFLRSVEQTGLIQPLTETVLDQAIRDCVAWDRQGLELSVSVNLSVRNLFDAALPKLVAATLERHRFDARRLKLEITESMIMTDPQRALATVSEIRALGVLLAVDDFGTGHASLANLRLLPVDELKIDRSFVTPMLQHPSDLVIVRSTVELGHALGLRVVAEGVEDSETLEVLAAMGCDRAQGHFFSKPIPAAPFYEWAHLFGATAV